jgi:hypothetical protein
MKGKTGSGETCKRSRRRAGWEMTLFLIIRRAKMHEWLQNSSDITFVSRGYFSSLL